MLLGSILCCLDLVAYFCTLGPIWTLMSCFHRRPKMVNTSGKPDSAKRRDTSIPNLLESPHPGEVSTLTDLMLRSVQKFPQRPCFGTRDYLGELSEPDASKGQRFKPKHFGQTMWLNYAQVGERVKNFGAGLRALGMEAQPRTDQFDDATGNFNFCIYENTCAEWLVACQGAFSQSMVVATVYATMGLDAVHDVVNECNAYGLMCNRSLLSKVAKHASGMPCLRLVVYCDDMVAKSERGQKPSAQIAEFAAIDGGRIRVLSVDEVIELGRSNPVDIVKPTKESVAVVMYTSGSTGKPKGVVIKHRNLLGMVAGLKDHLFNYGSVSAKEGYEVYAAFLPNAHILELAAEHFCMSMGFALGFADPRTLTSSGAEPHGALEEFKPTILTAVPKIWDIIKKGVESKAKAAGAKNEYLLNMAIGWKSRSMSWGMSTPLFDALIFSKIKAVTGGRVHIAISGGGPLDREVQQFVAAAVCPLNQGYGLTETCGGGCVQVVGDSRFGSVGYPLASVEIRLVDATTEDGSGPLCDTKGTPYRVTDRVNVRGEPCGGRGEIYIGGVVVAEGYYKNPKLTAETFVKIDGGRYMATGDIGEWTTDGNLKIVDRKKNLVKLKGGEYVALEFMEMKLGNSSFVDALGGGVMVYAGGDVDRPSAFVQVSRKALNDWATTQGLSLSYEELLKSPVARKAVMADLNRCGKAGGLGALETLVGVVLLDGNMGNGPDAWTPANGGLTATNKLNRRKATELVGEERMFLVKEAVKV